MALFEYEPAGKSLLLFDRDKIGGILHFWTHNSHVDLALRKSGDLFLNFLDLRGVTVARNMKTRSDVGGDCS